MRIPREALKGKRRILVLCVDRDDDLGRITGIKSPVIGREANLRAAMEFALKAPENSDMNTMFAAIQVCDYVSRMEGVEACEIATLTGLEGEGVEADMKIYRELEEVLEIFPADGVIFVSDGATDEYVIPIISSKIPIVSVRRVVVQQSRGVEETYVLLARYLRKLVEEPGPRKIVIGIPGIVLMLYSMLAMANLGRFFWIMAGLVVGLVGMVKGFGIDEKVVASWEHEQPVLLSAILGVLVLFVGVYIGYLGITEYWRPNIEPLFLIGIFLSYRYFGSISFIDTLTLSLIIFLVGRAISKYLRDAPGLLHGAWHEIVEATFIVTFKLVVDVAAYMLQVKGVEIALWVPELITRVTFSFVSTTALLIIFVSYERFSRHREKQS